MREYLETFFRRKWLFFLPFLAVLAVAVAGGVYTSWVYEVQARLTVRPNSLLADAGQQLSTAPSDTKDEYGRLSELLLTDNFLKSVVSSVPALKGRTDTPEKLKAEVDKLHKDLNAWAPGQSLINFRYVDRDPQVAQQVVSKTIDLFIAQRYADRVGTADAAIAFLTTQQTDYQKQLQDASTALSAWEAAHPVADRPKLPEAEQLNFERLHTNYDTVLAHLKYIGDELEKAKFTRDKMVATQATTYTVSDPPVVPANPNLSTNRLLGLLLVGLAVAAGLGFSVVAVATWLGIGRRDTLARSALPPWLNRMMTADEPAA